MELRYYGHSCFAVELQGKRLLFDPFITGNPWASGVDLDGIQPEFILISHGHGDHVGDTIELGKRHKAHIISTYEVVNWLEAHGVSGTGMNTGGKREFPFGTLRLVHAVHSSQLPDGAYGANPVGFCLYGKGFSFYFAGDTALTMDMQLIPLLCPPLDFAILPIGDHFTMGYEDAMLASDFIQCPKIVGCHYDTFSPIKIDRQQAQQAFLDRGKSLILPEIDQPFTV
ncbi:MAG: metal-dependent hydrolase [Saprospiraceae bacterium]|nr:metal-dependent hydrolase [Saprospiraceae bacterium]